MTFKEVIDELNKFQERLDDDDEMNFETLRAWAGHINACFIILIEEIHNNFEKLGILEDDEEEIKECENNFYA